MPDSMYDKLGDLLNEALESGELPKKENILFDSDDILINKGCENSDSNQEDSTLFKFNQQFNNHYKIKNEKIQTGTIFKREDLPKSYPPNIVKDLLFFGLNPSYLINLKHIKARYRELLKLNHPDKINNTNSEKNTQLIIEAYNRLSEYFSK